MKNMISRLVAAVILVHLAGGWSAAADPGVVREADKADAVKRILARKKFYLGEPEKPFCGQFLKDFRILKDMSFVEPVARAENYDDPVLEPYKARCGDLPLNERFACDPRATQGMKWSKDPREKRQQLLEFCDLYTGTASFKVFELDIDKNPKNGKELIMHFERAHGGDNVYWDGGYNVFNSRNCALIGGAPTHDPYSYFWRRTLENYNGILFYKDVVFGGAGHDLVVGGGGDDIVFGDIDCTLANINWTATVGPGFNVTLTNMNTLVTDFPGHDVIYAGTGNDLVFAGGGADEVDAGEGNDFVVGEDGDDSIFGGAGDDVHHLRLPLFRTILSNGQPAQNGFQALADLDGNTDGKVDATDSAFANLRIAHPISLAC